MPFRSPHPDVTIPNLTLGEFVLGRATGHGDRPALVDGLTDDRITYAELLTRVNALAAGLSRHGMRKGDVVALWSPNRPEWGVIFHAVSRLGAILTTANPTCTAEELAYQLTDSGARMLVTVSALLPRAREAVALGGRAIDVLTIDHAPDAASLESLASDAEPPAVTIDPATDVVVMPYSSGTTGLPKGVMLTHRNLVANITQIDAVETAECRALLAVLPFFHIYGMVLMLNLGLTKGSTIVTLPRFDLEAVLRLLQRWPIDLMHIVPPIALALAKHPVVDQFDLSGVRTFLCAAAPLGPAQGEALADRLSVTVRQAYGMTEASPATHYALPGRHRAGKVGPLLPNTEGRIVDTVTGADLGVGQAGEVWVRGPQVMKGYLNNPEATSATVDAEGWLRTGDIGVVDEEGELQIVDRLKELIKVKGFPVAPAELEALLLKHPAIADAAVIPVPDEECGEVPKAFIVARGPLTPDEVTAFVDAHAAHYKRVRHVALVEQIPKSASGKILRRVLVEQERARQAAGR